MAKHVVFLVVCCCSWMCMAAPASAQAADEPSVRDLIRILQTRIEMRDFQNSMTLKEVLGLIYEKLSSQGIELPFLVDQAGFRETAPDVKDIYEQEVKFAPYPRSMKIGTALELTLTQAHADATYLIRQGRVEIVPIKHASLQHLLKRKITGHFEGKFLSTVLEDLAELTGVSIQIDKRLTDKVNVQVAATFRNDVNLRDALVVLCDMGGVKMVELPTCVYVTTAENAASLGNELGKKSTKPAAK